MLPINYLLRNRYLIKDMLNTSNMATVYLACDNKTNEKVIVKECSGDNLQTKECIEREAEFLKNLDHSKIVCLKEYFMYSDNQFKQKFYIVMEYVEGNTLESLKDKLSIVELMHIAIKICKVINYLHITSNPPIIHRDIKPSNIMVLKDGTIKLIDFGTARFYNLNKSDTFTALTEGFAAPEQLFGKSTTRSDIFGIGATLYYMLTNKKIDYKQGFKNNIKPVSLVNRRVSREFNDIIMKAIAFEQKDRYKDAIEFRKALEDIAYKKDKKKESNEGNNSNIKKTNMVREENIEIKTKQLSDIDTPKQRNVDMNKVLIISGAICVFLIVIGLLVR